MQKNPMNVAQTADVANADVADVNLARSVFMSKMLMAADRVVFDASTFLQHKQIDEEGNERGFDCGPFWQHICCCAPQIQAIKYPNGEKRLLQIPQSCVWEIEKKARNEDGQVSARLNLAARMALVRLHTLEHVLKVLEVVPDTALGSFGDSALCAMAMLANSHEKLLYIIQDKPLGRDLLHSREMESFQTRHLVYRYDKWGFLCPIPSKKKAAQAATAQAAVPRPAAPAASAQATTPRPAAPAAAAQMTMPRPAASTPAAASRPAAPAATVQAAAPRPAASIPAATVQMATPRPAAPAPAASVQAATPTSRERGRGCIHNFRFGGPAPEEPDRALPAVGRMEPGDMLYLCNGTPLILGREIGSGREAQVFAIEGNEDHCIKVIVRPTLYKQQRINLLCSRDFEIDGCIFPNAPLSSDSEGTRFKAYLMRRIPDGASAPLAGLFNARVRSRYLPDGADRRFYARLALSLAQLIYRMHLRGILLCDVSAGNVRVALDENGKAIADRLYLIDIDSAQLGTEACVYSGDGMTPAYMAPELHRSGWNGEQIPYSAELFSASLLICQTLLCGAYPFTALDVAADEPFDEREAVCEGKFPYGSSAERRAAGTKAPGARAYIWSNMPSRLKDAMHRAMTAEPKDRPKLQELIPLLEDYNAWIQRDDTLTRYPMVRSLLPTAYKPYIRTCCACGREVDAANRAGGVLKGEIFMCPECAAQPLAKCSNPGCDHVTLTRGEELLGRRARSLCPDCFEKRQAEQGSRLSRYSTCSCGRSFVVRMEEVQGGRAPLQCPACRAAAAQPEAVRATPSTAPEADLPSDGGKKVRRIQQYIEELYRTLVG